VVHYLSILNEAEDMGHHEFTLHSTQKLL